MCQERNDSSGKSEGLGLRVTAPKPLVILHCKICGVLCPPNEQHTIGVISH